jgi:uncharacterized protein YjbI with pentapeptide repeats
MTELEVVGSTFKNCDFPEVNWIDAHLIDVTFDECNLSGIKLRGAGFSRVSFKNSKIAGLDFSQIRKLTASISFQECRLLYCLFGSMKLKRLQMTKCGIIGCQFENCDLSDAVFSGSDLTESTFTTCNLKGADFREATNYMLDVRNNALAGARFSASEALALLSPFKIKIDY